MHAYIHAYIILLALENSTINTAIIIRWCGWWQRGKATGSNSSTWGEEDAIVNTCIGGLAITPSNSPRGVIRAVQKSMTF